MQKLRSEKFKTLPIIYGQVGIQIHVKFTPSVYTKVAKSQSFCFKIKPLGAGVECVLDMKMAGWHLDGCIFAYTGNLDESDF